MTRLDTSVLSNCISLLIFYRTRQYEKGPKRAVDAIVQAIPRFKLNRQRLEYDVAKLKPFMKVTSGISGDEIIRNYDILLLSSALGKTRHFNVDRKPNQ